MEESNTLWVAMSSMNLQMISEAPIILGWLSTHWKHSLVAISPMPTKDVAMSKEQQTLTTPLLIECWYISLIQPFGFNKVGLDLFFLLSYIIMQIGHATSLYT